MTYGYRSAWDAWDRNEPPARITLHLFVGGGLCLVIGGFVVACAALTLLYRMFCPSSKQSPPSLPTN